MPSIHPAVGAPASLAVRLEDAVLVQDPLRPFYIPVRNPQLGHMWDALTQLQMGSLSIELSSFHSLGPRSSGWSRSISRMVILQNIAESSPRASIQQVQCTNVQKVSAGSTGAEDLYFGFLHWVKATHACPSATSDLVSATTMAIYIPSSSGTAV